jgi:hypothetical protein
MFSAIEGKGLEPDPSARGGNSMKKGALILIFASFLGLLVIGIHAAGQFKAEENADFAKWEDFLATAKQVVNVKHFSHPCGKDISQEHGKEISHPYGKQFSHSPLE